MKRQLNAVELAQLDLVDQSIAANVVISTTKVMPPSADGVTIGNTIYIRPGHEQSLPLIAHELVHVEQWNTQGPVRFLLRYLGSYMKNLAGTRNHRAAYLAIPAEQEARARAASWVDKISGKPSQG